MKTKNLYLFFSLWLLTLLFLSGCGLSSTQETFENQYVLSSIRVQDEVIAAASIYPQGGALLLSDSGTGILLLGENRCGITWEKDAQSYIIHIRDLIASGMPENGMLELSLEEIGISFVFTEGSNESKGEGNATLVTGLGKWDGKWSGRLWFEEGRGEWSDYELRSMAVQGTVLTDANGSGEILLMNDAYSPMIPMMQLSFCTVEDELQCVSGFIMSYPIGEWEIDISCSVMLPSDMRETIIMHPDIYEYGHYYLSSETATVEENVEVMTLTGKCQDTEGSFTFTIEMTRA